MICPNCQVEAHDVSQFCASCGKKLATNDTINHKEPLNRIFLVSMVLLVYIVVLQLVEIQANYFNSLILDVVFALFVLIFVIFDWKNILPLFKLKKIDWKLVGLIVFVTPICSYSIGLIVDYLNNSVFHTFTGNFIAPYQDSPSPLLFALISVAIFPALFEEIAFRGIVFNEFIKISSPQGAYIVSAVLFTLLHLSVWSIFWILPLGLILARLRYKKETLWYGILIHFLWNATVVVTDYFQWIS